MLFRSNVMNLSGDLNKKNYIFNNIVWEKNNYLVRLGLTNHYFKSPSRMIFNKINTFCPQIVFIQDMNSVSIEMLKFMKSKKIILVGEIASRIPPLKFLKKYDLIFSALPQFVNYFRKNHLKSEYLPLAFNNAVLKKINLPVVRTIQISFVGSISSHKIGRAHV